MVRNVNMERKIPNCRVPIWDLRMVEFEDVLDVLPTLYTTATKEN